MPISFVRPFADDDRFTIRRINLYASGSRSRVPRPLRTLAHHGATAWRARRLARGPQVDLYHIVDGSHGYLAQCLGAVPVVATVHDVIPWLQCRGRFPVPPPRSIARFVIQRSLKGLSVAEALICDSHATLDDLQEAIPQLRADTSVIFPPLERAFTHRSESTEGSETTGTTNWVLDHPFIFHIGNNGFYKNRVGVLAIFRALHKRVPHALVMAGPPPTMEMRQWVEAAGLQDRVKFLVDPSDAIVKACYTHASLLLFPSLYEGFGWPPLEAMAIGCPVVVSRSGSLEEVVGGAAMVGNAADVSEMAERCYQVLSEPQVAADLRARGQAHTASSASNDFIVHYRNFIGRYLVKHVDRSLLWMSGASLFGCLE